MSGISSMPPISSLQRYLTDAHDSLRTKKNEHDNQVKTSGHLKANENHHEHLKEAHLLDFKK
jgi:hypothetical protein